MSEVYQPQGMRDVPAMERMIAEVMYQQGNQPPHYPMPAVPITTLWGRDWVAQYKGHIGMPQGMPSNVNFWD